MSENSFPVNLYFKNTPVKTETIDLCRGADDFRKVYIVDDGKRKIVIKHSSNLFTDENRINGWIRVMRSYNALGIYCPMVVDNLNGEKIYHYCENERDYYVFAEEFAAYPTAEKIGRKKLKDKSGKSTYLPDLFRAMGKVATARLDDVDWPSAYCMLEPHSAADTTDESTECAIKFTDLVKEKFPKYSERAEKLLELFYRNQAELKKVYYELPTSCFQADAHDGNVLLDENNRFVGLIDFNLCGREPVLNYTIREAMWNTENNKLYGRKGRRRFLYSKKLDELRIECFLDNVKNIQEFYEFSEFEREVFPVLFRYMNSYWWYHINEIKRIKFGSRRVLKILDWLEHQMTRDDIRLP
ncbi:MAG: phosphotransferase [Clostridia bacterium]|nr:phosphotransferase [Clostridia bacterium]